ncbi:phosphopentomutase [Maritimibacter sp. UBA3975]|uniref:phosphopentomutase n=1 Tax=Maritimibacter sp. UBA3975 TaxID=1946833 RepID=UPI000C0AE8AD|nr:phosphopentomutase [Maritimibacter sp. UBA3975]MAM60665.1 phosphopentomutase [Maritimibacter sp.]|tara:strand:+ start:14799 stop:16010 length:1212 start_codon:yes stop_codon:yes gene_type:complete
MTRAFLIVMDSVGIGGAPDADAFFNDGTPDTGSNTVGHIAEACAAGLADEGRAGALQLPNLDRLGLGMAVKLASDMVAPGLGADPAGAWGAATEVSRGKDTPSGHWELAGVPVPFDWTYFPDEEPAFPPEITQAICDAAGVDAILGDKHASGTVILEELGAEHLRTGLPICYTSADSVLQIAAHEEVFGLQRLYDVCEAIAPMLHERRVGRVIARPFLGDADSGFERTVNRRDFALAAPEPTLLDWVVEAGRPMHAVGKIGDIFAHRGVTDNAKGADEDLMEALIALGGTAEEGSLTFANFVEFDSKYGHRRNVAGYARHLEWFDAQLGRFFATMREGDLVIFTADHGNDPTWVGTDHTRERVPVLCQGIGMRKLGLIAFADVAASVAEHLGLTPRGAGRSFL